MEHFVIFLTCICSGVLTGLLGVGGGIVVVPIFLTVLPIFGLSFDIGKIIGVSATCVFINSAVGIFYRRKEKFLPIKFLGTLGLLVILGTFFGNYFSAISPKWLILTVYLIFAAISLYSLKNDLQFDFKKNNLIWLLYPIFLFIGMISAMIGIGGAIFFTSTLKSFTNISTKKLLPTVTLLVLINAFFVFLGKLVIKDVTFMIIPIAFVASLIGVKIGIEISKKCTSKTLNNLLILVLIFAIIRIIIELFVG